MVGQLFPARFRQGARIVRQVAVPKFTTTRPYYGIREQAGWTTPEEALRERQDLDAMDAQYPNEVPYLNIAERKLEKELTAVLKKERMEERRREKQSVTRVMERGFWRKLKIYLKLE